VSYIREKGKPVVVATDVVPPPATVEKIKRSFKATLFVPNERIAVEEKVKLARPYGYGNDHERDALAAAVKAYNAYKNKFAQIDRKVPAHMTGDVKAMAVGGKTIDAAVEMLKPRPGPTKVPAAPPKPQEADDGALAELREQLRRKDEQIRNLQSYVSDLKRDMRQTERRMEWQNKKLGELQQRGLDDVRKGKEVTIRDREIARLKKEIYDERRRNNDLRSNIDRLKQIRVLEFRGDKSPVKIIDSLSKDAITACDRKLGLKPGDIVFVRDAGGGNESAAMLIERGVKAVIRGTFMSHLAEDKFQEARVPVISKDEVALKIVDDFAVIDPKKYDAAIERWKASMVRTEKEKSAEWFQGIVDDYKSERRREYRNSTKQDP
jgi:predicted RNase H-like nuclease (RuvC/YqgF family)